MRRESSGLKERTEGGGSLGNFIFHSRGRETASQNQEKKEHRKAGAHGGSRLSRKDRRKLLVYGIILGVWVLLAVLVPLFWPFSYSEQNGDIRNQAFSLTHWFGTDRFGRDLFARVWYGAGISLLVGISSTLINGILGILVGAFSGWLGGAADMVLMRIGDIISSIPSMIYVILIMLAAGSGPGSIILGLCVAGWVDMARIVRGEILRLKETDYACAAKMEGLSSMRILFRHLLPNAAGPILVNLIFLIPQAIFTESFLSFLGVGIAAPAASLGTIIQEARSQMVLYPWQMACPLVVLCVMLLCLNAVGSVLENQTGSAGGNRTLYHWDNIIADKSRPAGMMTEGRESK